MEIEPESTHVIEKIGWVYFFTIVNEHHIEVTRQFSLSLRENISQIGNLRLVITKDLIEKATKLPRKG